MANEYQRYGKAILKSVSEDFKKCFREPKEPPFKYPFIVPGSVYSGTLWDWDSWLTNVAIRQILNDTGDEQMRNDILPYEQGCVLNFLDWSTDGDGWIPIAVSYGDDIASLKPENIYEANMHKPVLAQHAAFLVKSENGNAEWLRGDIEKLLAFVNNYKCHHKHRCGLYYWQDDCMIGVDNDPCTFFRPAKSSGSIYLNCLMYKELEAVGYLLEQLGLEETAVFYRQDAAELKETINRHCWDERDGFYYSVDLNLLPNDNIVGLHQNMPRDWDCLIQRIGVWSGFLGLWSGIADDQQAQRIVSEHYRNEKTFNSAYGIRSLSKMEKMYNTRASGNPSNWLGPIWGVVNYMTFRGLVNYGYFDEARELAEKMIKLFGRDVERFGAFHEIYQPDDGEPIMNIGFQSWNSLIVNVLAWYEGRQVVTEFATGPISK